MKKFNGISYTKNPAPEYACAVCWWQLGRVIGSGCREHSAESKVEYRSRENKGK